MNDSGPRPWWALAMLLTALTGCDLPGQPKLADRYRRPDEVLDFPTLYQQHCAACHGTDGTMGPAPPLHDDLFRAIVPAEQLEEVLTNGRPGTMMPPFAQKNGGVLTAQQLQVLIHEIKGIPYRDAKNETVQPAWGVPRMPDPLPPPYLAREAGNARNGEDVFLQACSGCHGPDGLGIRREGRIIRLLNDPVFLALTSNQALRRIMITGRPDLRMPTFAGKAGRDDDFRPLTSQEIADVVALLALWREGSLPNGR